MESKITPDKEDRDLYQGQGLLGHKKESLVIHVRVPFSIKRRVYYEKSILREEYIYEKRRKEYIIV